MTQKKTIWFDITNVPHVNFLLPIIRKYEGEFEMVFSVRDFAETKGLFEKRIDIYFSFFPGFWSFVLEILLFIY